MRISREYHYDSAHQLPHMPTGHKCARLHGHTYRLIVEITGPIHDGLVMDFAAIDSHVDPVLALLDHHYLNDVDGLDNPTVETQLVWLWQALVGLPLHQLTLYEGLSNYGTYGGES